MLSLWLCYVGSGNSLSFYSKKAYSNWKRKCQLLMQDVSNTAVVKKRTFGINCNKYTRKYHKKVIPENVAYTSYSFLKRNHAKPHGHHMNTLLQKRWISYKRETSRLKRTGNILVALLPEKVLQKFFRRITAKTSKPAINCLQPNASNLYEHQHLLDFPNFFSKDAAPNLIRFNSTHSDLKRKSSVLQSRANTVSVPDQGQNDRNLTSDETGFKDENNLQNIDVKKITQDTVSYDSNAIATRSQYENLASTLSSKEDAAIRDEKSVLASFRTYVEIPVNSFFSFLSRANISSNEKLSLSSSADKTDDTPQSQSKDQKVDVEEEQVVPTKSLLEILYQYIPYVRSSSVVSTEQPDRRKKPDDAIRLKAEKELLLQKVNINNRTRYLLQAITGSHGLFNLTQYVDELKDHLLRFPDTRITAVKENGVKEIMHIYRTTHDKELLPSLRMILAMLGVVDPPKMKGVRILAIDGGGSRGLASVEICRRLVELTNRPIHEMFDYICGVSTGAILGFSLGVKKTSFDDLSLLYRELSTQIFKQNRLAGTGGLMLSHAYYSTDNYQKKMREVFGNKLLIETAAMEDVPKCSAVSTLVNRLPLKPFMWRNYSIVPGTRDTHWNGTCRGTMWEAVRASSAAPGYFEEYKKDYNIHQDGGVLTNNPTGVALNECRLLWPNDPIQCVVSIGTGRYEPVVGPVGEDFSSLKDKLMKFVDSATNVTEIHKVMYDLLPKGTYFRFNPYMDEPLLLDEYRTEKMDMLVQNTLNYIEANDFKFRACANALLDKRVHKKKY